jgi:hypothetical protein
MRSIFIRGGLLGMFLLTLLSCENVLEEYNPSGLTSETVFTTPEGFETLVSAAYSYQRWWYGKEEGYNIAETGTDIWTSGAGEVYRDLTSISTFKVVMQRLPMNGGSFTRLSICAMAVSTGSARLVFPKPCVRCGKGS